MNSLYERGLVSPAAVPDFPKSFPVSSILALVCNLSRGLVEAIRIREVRFLTDSGMRIDHSLNFNLSIVEHVVCSSEVSLFEVFLVGSVAKEEMIRHSFSQVI